MRLRGLTLSLVLVPALWLGSTQPASAETATFGFTGAEQTYTVPAGVHLIHVTATGAAGGRGVSDTDPGGEGGLGGRVAADLTVAPGQVLFIEVGGRGEDGTEVGGGAGGFNGGGNSVFGMFAHPGGGGGGATDLRTCSRNAASCPSAPDTLASRVLVAAGGGGGGSEGAGGGSSFGRGGDGGKDGISGGEANCAGRTPGGGGGSGSQAAGGASGPGGSEGASSGGAGALGIGGVGSGDGIFNIQIGGGGGGGLFGGGAGGSANGCAGGGGGGGSSFAVASAGNVSSGASAEPAGVVITTPSSTFRTGKLTRNKRKGTATLTVELPGPGTLSLGGKGLVGRQRPVGSAETVTLVIKARGGVARKLTRKGRVKLRASISYSAVGADSNTVTRPIKLVKRRARG
jgi:hypothetical protein